MPTTSPSAPSAPPTPAAVPVRQPVTTARMLLVEPLGYVDALLETPPPHPTRSRFSHAHTDAPLQSVLRRALWHVPPDTPIARLDLLPYHQGHDFLLRGPMPEASLPTGAIRPPTGSRRTYRGERWDTLGMLTSVSIDVYLALVSQVGGTVTLISALTICFGLSPQRRRSDSHSGCPRQARPIAADHHQGGFAASPL